MLPDPNILTQRQFIIDELVEMAKEKVSSYKLKIEALSKASQKDQGDPDSLV